MRFRKPTAPDPVIIQSLIALFDAIHSALHSLKNAVMVLPVTDSQGNENLVAELSYCFSVENAEAVRAYGSSVQSLFKKLAGQQPHVESALANFPPALSEQLTSTIASLLQQGPEVAERIDRFGLHVQRFSTLDAMTPEEREAFLPYAKAHLDALYGLLADEEEGLLHRVSAALEPFEVGSILSAAARPVRARAQALGIQMEIPAVSKRLRLQSNPQPLTEVLDGLLSNALDAVMEQTSPVSRFRTAKGSEYVVHNDGSTTRNKAARPEHPGRYGPRPRSERTFYVTPEEATVLNEIQIHGGVERAIQETGDGRIGMRYLAGKDAGKFEERTVVMPRTSPAKGLIPIETLQDGKRVHFGNEIIEVHSAAIVAKGAGNGGEIRVAVKDNDGTIEIRITDNGCGIAPEQLQRIRNGEQVTTKGKGHGNGLPSARQQLSGYSNASLDLESEGVGRGACAVVRLDLARRVVAEPSVSPRQRRTLLAATALALALIVAGLSWRVSHPVPNPIAVRQYHEGQDFLNKRNKADFKHAIACFKEAIRIDPGYALGYSGLADSHALMSWYGEERPEDSFREARRAAEKAVEIDPYLAETHTSRAGVYLFYDWNWPKAKDEFKRALDLDPSYDRAHHWYALFFAGKGQFADGIAELEKVQAHPLLPPIISTNIAQFNFWSGKYDAALKQLDSTLADDPNFYRAHLERGRVYEQQRMYAKAIESFQKAVILSQGSSLTLAALGHAQAVSGDGPAALKVLAKLRERRKEFDQSGKDTYAASYHIAVVYAGLGEKENALVWLTKAVREHDTWLLFLKGEPMFASYYENPRFQLLLKKMHLEE